MTRTRKALIWAALAVVVAVPLVFAATSPLLQWRQPIYIIGGFAGVVGLALLLLQPLLMGGYLPGLPPRSGRRVHRWVGALLIGSVVLHVVGLWITSPPDVVDALLFRAPTPFSTWGVIAMWAIFATGLLVLLRGRLRISMRSWRIGHTALAVIIVVGTVIHAVQIDGTMEIVSKVVLCVAVVAATVIVMADLRVWAKQAKARRSGAPSRPVGGPG